MKVKDSIGLVISIQVTLLWVNIHLSKAVLSLAGYLYSITCTGQLEVTGCKFHWKLYSKKACTLLIDCTVSVICSFTGSYICISLQRLWENLRQTFCHLK